MRRESYLLSNGRSIVFTDRKLWLTRNGELSDVLKSLLAVGFAVVSFVTTMAAAAGLAQQVSLPGVLCLIAGSAGLYTTWLFFRQAMGAIAGLPELVLERSGDRLTVFGADYDLSTARFFGAWCWAFARVGWTSRFCRASIRMKLTRWRRISTRRCWGM